MLNGTESLSISCAPYPGSHSLGIAAFPSSQQSIIVCNYSPLTGRFLTGKYERITPLISGLPKHLTGCADMDDFLSAYYLSERGWQVIGAIRDVADEVDTTPAKVSLRWLM